MKITSVPAVDNLLRTALAEDAGNGDITTTSTIPENAVAYGRYMAKEDGVLCGMDVVRAVFDLLDEDIELTVHVSEGAHFKKGDVLAEVSSSIVPADAASSARQPLNLPLHPPSSPWILPPAGVSGADLPLSQTAV